MRLSKFPFTLVFLQSDRSATTPFVSQLTFKRSSPRYSCRLAMKDPRANGENVDMVIKSDDYARSLISPVQDALKSGDNTLRGYRNGQTAQTAASEIASIGN